MAVRILSALMFSAVMLWAGVALADETPDLRAVARQKFAEGRREFDQHNYRRALELLKESYAMAPYPDLLFNIGRCDEELGHYREALEAYERYLAVNPGDSDVRRRAEIMRQRAPDEPLPSAEPLPVPSSSPEPLVVAPEPLVIAQHKRTPVYRKWWLWTAVIGVAAVAVGVGLGIGLSGPAPSRTFPPLGSQ